MNTITSAEYIAYLTKNTPPILAYDCSQDINVWQEVARAKLVDLLKLPLEKGELKFSIIKKVFKEDYTQIDFEFQSEPGYVVPCSILVPAGCNGPLPTVICLQGHSTGMHISLGVPKYEGDKELIAGGRDFAVRAVHEGYCAIAVEQRYMGICGQNEKGTPECLTNNSALVTMLMGRTVVGERVWDIMRLIDVLEIHLTEYVDIQQIICMGNSGGGTATFYASCLDERIYLSIPSCAVCTYEESIMSMYHCPCNFVPDIRKYFNMGDIGCLIAPRRLVMVCGIEDEIFPIHGVEECYQIIHSAYKSVGKGELCCLIKGNGGHQFYPDEAWPVVKKLMQEK